MTMKKILFLSSLAIAATFTVSCNKENIEGDAATAGESALFPASSVISASSASTKTTLDGTSILWAEGDAITLFGEDGTPVKYDLVSGEGTKSGQFENQAAAGQVTAYAVYPATENTLAESKVAVTVAAAQNYAADGFPTDYPMAAVTENGTDFTFENLATVLRLQLKGDATVASVTVRTLGENESIAGDAAIYFTSGTPVLAASAEGAASAVTLDCGDGVALSAENETVFNFILIPGEYDGFEITVTDVNGHETVRTTGAVELKAGSIKTFESPLDIYSTPQGWNLTGSFTNNWQSWIDLSGGHGIYYCTNITVPADEGSFKIRKGASQWYGQTGAVEVLKPVKANENGSGDFTIAPGTYDFYFVEDNTNVIVTEAGTAAFSVIGNINGTSFDTDFPMIVENGWLVAKGIEFTGNTFKIRTTGSWSTNEQNYYYNIGTGECSVGNSCNVWSYVGTTDMTVTGTEAGKKYDIYLDMKRHDPNNSADNMTVWVMPEGQVPGQSAE